MKVEKVIADELRGRDDLVKVMGAAAEYLASRDKDADSRARAVWKLWSGADGKPLISLQLDDEGYSSAHNFSPTQLELAGMRELRLVMIWNDVLSERTWRQHDRVNELIRQFQEG